MPVYKRTPLYKSFSAVTSSTVANTTTPTAFSQSYTIKSDSLTLGKSIHLIGRGVYSTLAATPGSENIFVNLNSLTIATSGGFTASANKVNAMAHVDVIITCLATGVSGTIEVQGMFTNETGNGAAQLFSLENVAGITINTTLDQVLKIAVQWGTADPANTVTLRQFVVEELG